MSAPPTGNRYVAGFPMLLPAAHSADRLAAPRILGQRETAPEASLDRTCRLARRVLAVPAASISLVDVERQFFESCVGWGAPFSVKLDAAELHSLAESVTGGLPLAGPLWVEDARRDRRLCAARAVVELGVVAYMALPVRSSRGDWLGTFCVADRAPRSWTPCERAAMEELVELVESEVRVRERERALRLRDDLIAIVSHDLRSPLNAALLSLETLRAKGSAGEEHERIERGLRDMSELVGKLLDVATLEREGLASRVRPIHPDALLAEARGTYEPSAREVGVRLVHESAEDLPLVSADRGLVLQVFSNLITNALRHAGEGEVRLGARATASGVRFEVRDQGPGLSPEEGAHAFDRYWRKEGARGEGVGLGLAIVESIVLAHGGEVGVESRVGEGACFWFTLPFASAPVPA